MPKIAAIVLLAATPCVVLAASPSSSWAHGGIYQGPGGAVPPHLRDPSDPVPPPPPPPSGPTTPPDTTGPTGPTPTPGPVTPPTPPAPQPPTVTPPDGSGGVGPRRGTSIGFDDWTFWWAYEAPSILRVKEEIYRLRISPQGGFALGEVRGRTDAHRATEVSIRETL